MNYDIHLRLSFNPRLFISLLQSPLSISLKSEFALVIINKCGFKILQTRDILRRLRDSTISAMTRVHSLSIISIINRADLSRLYVRALRGPIP